MGVVCVEQFAFLVTKFVVAAADHGYCGAPHQRKASFELGVHDTGVFALCSPKAQSTVAGKRFGAQNGAVFERDVREAFAGARLSEGSLVARQTRHTENAAAAAAGGGKSDEKKKRKALFNRDGGEKEKDETEKTEKKRENKAAKKRRKRREEKAKQEKKALSADAENTTKTETSV